MSSVTEQQVSDYLSRRLGTPLKINKMRQTFPGLSRETLIVFTETGSGEKQDFAVRLDYPWGGSCPHPMRHEWETYSRLWGSQVPVAEPLWYDEGIEFAEGRPHMVRRLVDGSMTVPGLAEDSEAGRQLRQRVAFECAEKLALVHTVDWKALGFDGFMTVPDDPVDALRAELRLWRKRWDAGRPGPFPVIEEALCWLEETLPRETPRLSLTKGNNGLGEEIFRGEKIVAMSDWELSTLSDGVIDLAFSQGTLTLADFGQTLRHYENCVGSKVSPERLAGGAFVTWFKMIVCAVVHMAKNELDGTDDRITNLSFGLIVGKGVEQRLGHCIGRNLVDAWSSLVSDEQSSYFRAEKSK